MYCIKCGVRLSDTEKNCPLCATRCYHPDLPRPSATPLYPVNHQPHFSPTGAMSAITVLFLIPLLICLLCDLRINSAVTWSGYVMGAIVLIYEIFFLPGWFRKPNPVIFVPCGFAAVALYLLYINFYTGGTWFLPFAFPLVGCLCSLHWADYLASLCASGKTLHFRRLDADFWNLYAGPGIPDHPGIPSALHRLVHLSLCGAGAFGQLPDFSGHLQTRSGKYAAKILYIIGG